MPDGLLTTPTPPGWRELFDEAADDVEVVRRLWDSWEDDAEIRDAATGRFVDRDKLHYIDFEGAHFSVRGPVDHAAAAAGPAGRRRARPPRRRVPAGRALRRRRVRHAARRRRTRPPILGDDPRRAGRGRARSARPCTCSATSWCSSTASAAAAAERKDRLDELPAGAAAVRQRRARVRRHPGRARRPGSGVAGGRADRPAAAARRAARRPDADHPRPGAGAAARAAPSAPGTRPTPCAGCSASPAPPTATPTGAVEEHRCRASRSTSPPTSPASTTPPSGATRRPAARSSSPRSCTSPRPPSAAKFDFFFLAEGLRLREQNGQIYDLDVVGRPDTFTVLAALAAVTDRLGLAGTINSTFNEPYELARQFATLDHLSAGRAGVERRHVVGRVHRRELPPRRLPRRRTSATTRAARVPRRRPRAVGLVAAATRSSPTRQRARSSPTRTPGAFAVHVRAVRHRGPLHGARAARRATR